MNQFEISLQVSQQEIKSWHPERVNAFFRGVAMALAARGGMRLDDPNHNHQYPICQQTQGIED